MRAGVSRFILVSILVLALALVSSAVVPQPLALLDLLAGSLLTAVDTTGTPPAVVLGRFDNCNDLSCG